MLCPCLYLSTHIDFGVPQSIKVEVNWLKSLCIVLHSFTPPPALFLAVQCLPHHEAFQVRPNFVQPKRAVKKNNPITPYTKH